MSEHEKNNDDIQSATGFGKMPDASILGVKPEAEEVSGMKAECGEAESKVEPEAKAEAEAGSSSGEYSFRREQLPNRTYMDASFQSRDELKTPKFYYTPPVKPVKKKKAKKPIGAGALIAACLVCALLGGLGGGAVVAGQLGVYKAPAVYGGSPLNVSNGEPTSTPDASTIATGQKLTGAEIYALGCEQAVGIKTEVTYKNFLGVETATAVSGSGFIVTEDGYIVTNFHVVKTAYEGGYKVYVVLFNGESYPAEIVGFEKDSDLAVLKINVTGLPAATLGNSDYIRVGDAIYAIGNPLGELNFSMTTGSVSALDRSITTTDEKTGETTTNNMFQIDAAVNEGNSGGPVYNDVGEVVGIVTAKYADTGVEGLGFAIPIKDVLRLIEDLIEFGYVTGKPSFGIMAKTVDSVSANYYGISSGAEVVTVNPGSCSEAAGILVGDIITALGDKRISSTSDLLAAKKLYKAGETVTVTVYRDGEYLELSLTFDEESIVTTSENSELESPKEERNKLPTVPKDN